MGVPAQAPSAVHEYWANIPNCAEINFIFKSKILGVIERVKCEGWGQLAHDNAATDQVFYHIKNKKKCWDWEYVGWEEIDGTRKGDAPADFKEQYRKYWEAL